MKRYFALMLVIVMAFSLAACAGKTDDQQAADTAEPIEEVKETEAPDAVKVTNPPTEAPTEAPTEEPTPEPTEAAPAEPFDVSMVYEEPERPMVVQLDGSAYHIDDGDELKTWSTVYYLTEDGRLYAYGDNSNYQLGTGNTEMSAEPVLVMEGVRSINGEGCRIFAFKEDATLWTWGVSSPWYDRHDPCGFTEPTMILEGVAQYDGAFALTSGGELWLNENCEDGKLSPAKLMDSVASFSSASFSQVSIVTTEGELHSYSYYGEPDGAGGYTWQWGGGLTATGVKQAFGRGNFYLGTDNVLYAFSYGESDDAASIAIIDDVYKAYTGYGWAYAIRNDGSLWGWCDSYGAGNWFPSGCIGEAQKLLDRVVHVEAEYYMDEDFGVTYAIALTADGELYGWGPNWFGELAGVDAYAIVGEPQETAAQMADSVKMFWSDGVDTFIIKDDGSLWGTGYNGAKGSPWEQFDGIGLDPDEGRLGDGTCETHKTDGWYTFVKIADNAEYICQRLGTVYTDYEDGTDSTQTFARVFMLDSDGSLWAWGFNKDGCLQRRGTAYLLSPVKIIDSAIFSDR